MTEVLSERGRCKSKHFQPEALHRLGDSCKDSTLATEYYRPQL